jgi:hypothetical protein
MGNSTRIKLLSMVLLALLLIGIQDGFAFSIINEPDTSSRIGTENPSDTTANSNSPTGTWIRLGAGFHNKGTSLSDCLALSAGIEFRTSRPWAITFDYFRAWERISTGDHSSEVDFSGYINAGLKLRLFYGNISFSGETGVASFGWLPLSYYIIGTDYPISDDIALLVQMRHHQYSFNPPFYFLLTISVRN